MSSPSKTSTNFTFNSVPRKAIVGGIGAFILLLFLLIIGPPVSVIQAGHVGVLTQFGATTGTELTPGFHLRMPILQVVSDFKIQTQLDQSDNVEAASADLQTVTTTVAVNFHPDPLQITSIYQKTGVDYQQKILAPAIPEAVKSVTAQFTASQLIQERALVQEDITNALAARVAPFHILIDTVNVVNFTFSDAFNSAIEAKQVAQQNVLTAQQKLDQAKIDAQQQVVTAQADAQAQIAAANGNAQAVLINAKANAAAQTLQEKTLTPLYLQLVSIQKWNGQLPTYTTVPVPFLPVVK